MFSSTKTKRFIDNLLINWEFILEHSPWFGGFYECCIDIVKSCIKKVVRRAHLTLEKLNTVLIEIETVLNGRPLTHLNDEESCDSLTLNHLVHGPSLFRRSNNKFNEIDNSDNDRQINLDCLQERH